VDNRDMMGKIYSEALFDNKDLGTKLLARANGLIARLNIPYEDQKAFVFEYVTAFNDAVLISCIECMFKQRQVPKDEVKSVLRHILRRRETALYTMVDTLYKEIVLKKNEH